MNSAIPTVSGSFDSSEPPAMPTAGGQSYESFCESNNFLPPKCAVGKTTTDVEKEVRTKLGLDWRTLDDEEKIRSGFLALRNQKQCLLNKGRTEEEASACIMDALNPKSECGKRLEAFLRRGRDKIEDQDVGLQQPDAFSRFLNQTRTVTVHEAGHGNAMSESIELQLEWHDPKKNPTIFNVHNLMPLMWYQTADSTVCFLIACELAIFYGVCKNNGPPRSDTDVSAAVVSCKLNAGRFMRNYFTPMEVANYVFEYGGGYPEKVLQNLLRCHNPDAWNVTEVVRLAEPDGSPYEAGKAFNFVDGALRHNCALIVLLKQFQGLSKSDELCSHGDFKSKELPATLGHAALIVGVQRARTKDNRDVMGGLVFLVQNSSEKKPFFLLGYDLLVSMGITELTCIAPNLIFDASDYGHDADLSTPRSFSSGSSQQSQGEKAQNNKKEDWASDKNYFHSFDRKNPPIFRT